MQLGEVVNNQTVPLLIKGIYAVFDKDESYNFGNFEFTSDLLKSGEIETKMFSLEILET